MPGTTLNKVDAINVAAPKGGHIWIHDNEFYHCHEAVDIAGEGEHVVERNKIIAPSRWHGIKLHSQLASLSDTVVRSNLIVGAYAWGIAIKNRTRVKIPTIPSSRGLSGAGPLPWATSAIHRRRGRLPTAPSRATRSGTTSSGAWST